jgi:hypothetical protein
MSTAKAKGVVGSASLWKSRLWKTRKKAFMKGGGKKARKTLFSGEGK